MEVPTVAVDVIVTDRKGHHVSGLPKERFKVFEDNVPQEIVSFTPAGGAPAPSAPPSAGVPLPAKPGTDQAAQSGEPVAQQNISLVIDLGDLQYGNLKNATGAAARYVTKSTASGNLVSLYWVDSSLHLAVPFTGDKERLLGALDKLGSLVPSGRFTTRDRIQTQAQIDDLFSTLHPETLFGSQPIPGRERADPLFFTLQQNMNVLRSWLTIENTFQARAIFVALRAIAVSCRDIPGRKSVVVFSEGFLHAPEAGAELQSVIDAANRAGVAFYVIDASGANSGVTAESSAPVTGRRRSDPDMLVDTTDPVLGRTIFDWNASLTSDVHEDLGLVANATGGFLVTGTNDLASAIDRVELDGAQFYTLVYHPANRLYDGAFRKIKVTLDTGSLLLRYRRGYWAIPPGREVMMTPAAAQLLAALATGSRKPSFAPDINAGLVISRDGKFAISAAVSMPGHLPPLEKKKDQYSVGTTMLLVVRDAEAQIVSLSERYGNLNLDQKQRDAFQRKTFNMQGYVPVSALEPLTLQAVVQFSSGLIGMSAPLTVYSGTTASSPLLTALVLSSQAEQAACDADTTDPLCIGNLRLLLPAHPHFPAAGKLFAYFAALDLAVDLQTKLPALNVTFVFRAGQDIKQVAPEHIRALPGASPGSLRVLAEFDLEGLKPGQYSVKVDAEDTIRRAQASGEAEFTIK